MRTRAGGALQVTGRCGGRDACGRASGSVPRAEGKAYCKLSEPEIYRRGRFHHPTSGIKFPLSSPLEALGINGVDATEARVTVNPFLQCGRGSRPEGDAPRTTRWLRRPSRSRARLRRRRRRRRRRRPPRARDRRRRPRRIIRMRARLFRRSLTRARPPRDSARAGSRRSLTRARPPRDSARAGSRRSPSAV